LRSFLALQYFGRFRSEADKYQRRPWPTRSRM